MKQNLLKSILWAGIYEAVLFIMAILFPVVGLFLPKERIKYLKKNHEFEIIASYAAAVILIYIIFQVNGVIVYISLFLLAEIFYYIFEGIKIIEVLDKVLIVSAISTFFLAYAYFLNIEVIDGILEQARVFYSSDKYSMIMKMDDVMLTQTFAFMKRYMVTFIFFYVFTVNYMTYMLSETYKNVEKRISYYYLLLFLGAEVSKLVFGANIISDNLSAMIKVPFIVFGGMKLFNFVNRKGNKRILAGFITIIFSLFFFEMLFVFGGLASFFKRQVFRRKK